MLIFVFLPLLSCSNDGGKLIKDSDIIFYQCELGQFSSQGTIDSDLSSALDSLLKTPIVLPDTPYTVETKPFDVNLCLAAHCSKMEPNKKCMKHYSNPDRQFYLVTFQRDSQIIDTPRYILDNQGNLYHLTTRKHSFVNAPRHP